MQSEAIIGVGLKPSEIVHGFVGAKELGEVAGGGVKESSQSKVSWSWLSDVVTRGQPSKFGSSESEDSHRVRVS
ncbi:unnamed protein product [Heligmosomoides polygyrus]|uniref:Uncharacterized protein n=1 Tax=Heligmosomoides polygyrus TaxID=6339 RepID=A0A3P7UC94_HELPZ|nr:unnamed protein product [Heligmosomoides polygyrus]